jgi:predicted ATPase/transcriptional regulator with XRE-family HTH domain/Tfp pilus assembly protein PilF
LDTGTQFGSWLMQRRKALDLTRRELARSVGLSTVTVEKLESGERRPSRQVAELLARQLDVPDAELDAFVQFARSGVEALDGGTGQTGAGVAPWRALLHYPNNLPAQPTPFIGRQALLAELFDLVRQPGIRLLTLTGPPGIGKTRLSLALGTLALPHFADGVFFVALAPLRDPWLVIAAIAETLKIHEQAGRPLLEPIKEELRSKEMLLVLDNFEQVVEAGGTVAELLRGAPGLRVLVTSREALRVYGEHDFAVPPMEAPVPGEEPESVEALARYEAISLFVERARAADRTFGLNADNARAVARICVSLDSLPLAIELAAAQVRVLSPEEILARVGARLDLLSGGPRDVSPRQQALRGAIDWSYELLSEAEKIGFQRLAVFAGGCALPAAQAIAGEEAEELLQSLSSKSLLRRETGSDGETRFTMLETIREFALEKLRESGEERARRSDHAAYYLALEEEGSVHLRGPNQAEWLAKLEAEHDNMRSVLQWTISEGEANIALRLSSGLRWFWYMRDYLSEGRHWLEAAIKCASESRTPERGEALMSLGVLAERQGDHAEAVRALGESLQIFRDLEDVDGVARVLNNLGGVALEHGDYENADRYYEEALGIWREQGNRLLASMALHNLSIMAYTRAEYDRALALIRECLSILEEEGKAASIGRVLTTMGEIYRLQGNYEEAAKHYERSLEILRELGDKRGTSSVLMNLGHVEHYRGHLDEAESYITQALQLDVGAGDRAGITLDLAALAGVAGSRGQLERAARLFGAADALREAIGITFDTPDQVEYDRSLEATRARVPTELWERLWAEGKALPMERAIEYALALQHV